MNVIEPNAAEPHYTAPTSKPPKPDNYLVAAIISLLFCCWPFGIISIIYGTQVDSRWAAGDYYGAKDASQLARKWMLAAFITPAVCLLLYFIIMMCAVGCAIYFTALNP